MILMYELCTLDPKGFSFVAKESLHSESHDLRHQAFASAIGNVQAKTHLVGGYFALGGRVTRGNYQCCGHYSLHNWQL